MYGKFLNLKYLYSNDTKILLKINILLDENILNF